MDNGHILICTDTTQSYSVMLLLLIYFACVSTAATYIPKALLRATAQSVFGFVSMALLCML